MTIYSGFSHKKNVIFNSYVSLPEGNQWYNGMSLEIVEVVQDGDDHMWIANYDQNWRYRSVVAVLAYSWDSAGCNELRINMHKLCKSWSGL